MAFRAQTRGTGLDLLLILLFAQLAAGSAPAGQDFRLQTHPASLHLTSLDREHGFLVSLINDRGETKDVTAECDVHSLEDAVATLGADGGVEARSAGETRIVVSYQDQQVELPVTVDVLEDVPEPSFLQDVIPLLTRAGCNSGGCHGKISGQNGFRLSLRGYAPEWDHDWLTAELGGRRINPALPDQSLILLKAINRVPHEGGQRFGPRSRNYELLRSWIEHRAPGPQAEEPQPRRLQALPGNRTLRPGQTQPLLVRAIYDNGRSRDVTWLTQFYSNDESTLAVSEQGIITALRPGEASIRAHFQGLVEVILVTIPFNEQPAPQPYAQRFNIVDEHVFDKLQSLGIPPSPPSPDPVFVRRAFLDTIGALPSPDEAAAFAASADPDKRARLIDDLLKRPEYADYWTLQFADLLQNRKERDHDVRGIKGVRSFHSWLHEQIATNRPWDQLVRSILTADGSVAEHPQIGYFVTTIGEFRENEKSEVTDSVAQAFLGTRIGCARCHNHPLEKYTQDDFYHFAAFFSRVSLNRTDPTTGETRLVVATREEADTLRELEEARSRRATLQKGTDTDPLKGTDTEPLEETALEETHKKLVETEVKVAELEKRLAQLQARPPTVRQPRTHQAMIARPLDRAELDFPAGVDPRTRLADWMTDPQNKAFAGSMINRLWKHFMGTGLVEPVDDLRASNPPSNPELWTALSREFVDHDYDLKHVMRLILNSRAYQLSSETLEANATDQKFHSHYYLRRLPAEALMDAISQVTGVPDSFPGYPAGTRAVQLPDPSIGSYFLSLFGRSDRVTACACERKGEVTLPQLLHLYNSEEIHQKIHHQEGHLQALVSSNDDSALVDQLYLLALSRPPSDAERSRVLLALGQPEKEQRQATFGDLLWALLNTKEFAFNH